MDPFIIESIRKNQEEIDSLMKDTTMDETFKNRLLGILKEERDLLTDLKKSFEKEDE
jgi:erythromycin esterase-like protein